MGKQPWLIYLTTLGRLQLAFLIHQRISKSLWLYTLFTSVCSPSPMDNSYGSQLASLPKRATFSSTRQSSKQSILWRHSPTPHCLRLVTSFKVNPAFKVSPTWGLASTHRLLVGLPSADFCSWCTVIPKMLHLCPLLFPPSSYSLPPKPSVFPLFSAPSHKLTKCIWIFIIMIIILAPLSKIQDLTLTTESQKVRT
jgi:hypothetical protein